MDTLANLLFVLCLAMGTALTQGAEVDALTAKLTSDDARERWEACYELGKLGKEGEPALARIAVVLAKDETPNVRLFAAQALGEIAIHLQGGPGENLKLPVAVLTKALADTDAGVRLQAAQSLGNFGKNADLASEALGRVATSDGDIKVRRTALASLGTIGHHGGPQSKEALPYLKKALSDPDPEIRRLTAYVLSRFGEASRPLIPKLIETMQKGPHEARREAARTLGTYGPSAIAAVPALMEKLRQETHLSLRSEAAEAVIRIDATKSAEVAKVLVAATRSEDSGIRLFAMDALLEAIDEPKLIVEHVVPALKRLQGDPIVDIRLQATEALADFAEGPGQGADEAPESNKGDLKAPEILLDEATAPEGQAALTRVREFVVAWENGKLDDAVAMVDERLRLAYRKEMARDPLRVEAIESLRVFRNHGVLRARAGIDRVQQGGISLDLVFRDGQWWITEG